jgi:hypothetical protein
MIALSIVAIAYVSASSAFWLFLSLGTALFTSLLGILFSIIQLIQKNRSRTKTLFWLGANICVAAFSAIYFLGAIVIGIGFAV